MVAMHHVTLCKTRRYPGSERWRCVEAAKEGEVSAFNRVLLCYDGTREGQHALYDGALLVRKLKAETHVLCVLNSSPWVRGADITSAIPVDLVTESARAILDEGLKELAARGNQATGHFAIGDPLDLIPRFANDLRVDLVVIGHHPANTLARWWSGGRNDGLLLDRVSCSVLVTIGPQVETQVPVAWPASIDETAPSVGPGEGS